MQRAMWEGPANVGQMTVPTIARDEMGPTRAVDIRKTLYSWVTLGKKCTFLSYSGLDASEARRTGGGKAQNTVFQCLCHVKDAVLFLSYLCCDIERYNSCLRRFIPSLSFPYSSQIVLNCIFPLPYVFLFCPAHDRDSELAF
jgi:hypothetical protein